MIRNILLLYLLWCVQGLSSSSSSCRRGRLAISMNGGDGGRLLRSMSSTPFGEDQPTPQRRVKKNKYAKFSKTDTKKALETVEEAMVKVKKREAEDKVDISAAVRGTTVPTAKASPKIKKKVAKFDSYRRILPSDPATFGYIEIGTVGPPHGIKGELKVIMDNTDFAEDRLSAGSLIYIKKPSRRSPRPVRVSAARKQVGNQWLVSFENIINRAGAMAFRNFKVFVRAEDRPAIEKDEFLIRELVGLKCLMCRPSGEGEERSSGDDISGNNDEDEATIDRDLSWPDNTAFVAEVNGVIPPDDLCDPGVRHLMHAMLEINLRNSKKLCLIPLVPEIVKEVNVAAGYMVIEPPVGLLDYTYEEGPKREALRGFLPSTATSVGEELRRELERNTIEVPFLPSLVPVGTDE